MIFSNLIRKTPYQRAFVFVGLLLFLLLTVSNNHLLADDSSKKEDSEKPKLQLRVMSYNVKHGSGFSKRPIAENMKVQAAVIVKQKPDLVGLQEIDQKCRRSGSINQVKKYSELTKLNGAFGKFMDFDGGQYGLAVLSRFATKDVEVLNLPSGNTEPRVAIIHTFEITKGVKIAFVNVHFDWHRKSKERIEQAKTLVARLNKLDLPIIIAGDYNAQRNSPTLQVFTKAGYAYVGKQGSSNTFDAKNPSIEIDHICIKNSSKYKLTADKIKVIEEKEASDHRPIVTTVYVEKVEKK